MSGKNGKRQLEAEGLPASCRQDYDLVYVVQDVGDGVLLGVW